MPIKKTDFVFFPYKEEGVDREGTMVSYMSPKTGQVWVTVTYNWVLIDRTRNSEHPTQKSLRELIKLCKTN